jgi:hypothetical protein
MTVGDNDVGPALELSQVAHDPAAKKSLPSAKVDSYMIFWAPLASMRVITPLPNDSG